MDKHRIVKILKFCSIIVLVALAIWLLNHYGIERIRANIKQFGIWAPLGIFVLRFASSVIPALPGTGYSLIAGGLFGFTKGLIIVVPADIASCALSFYLSRRYGRDLVKKLVGDRFMNRVDKLTQRHLENNFFLMTAFMMTGLFDFVSYAVGLTKASPKKFMAALIIGVVISTIPIVALGAGIWEGSSWLLVLALLGVFALAFITGIVQNKKRGDSTKMNEQD